MENKSLTEQIALEIHRWHCPEEAEIDEAHWTGPSKREYLECAANLVTFLRSLDNKDLELSEEEIMVAMRPYATYISLNEHGRGQFGGIAQAQLTNVSPKIAALEEENRTIREKTLKEVGEWLDKTIKIDDLLVLHTRPNLLELVNGINSLKSGKLE